MSTGTMSSDTTTPMDVSGRHPINVGHLVMGIALLGLVGVWAAVEADAISGGDIRWLLPVPWVLGGLAGLLAIALGSRRRAAAPAYVGPTYATPYSTPDAGSADDTTVLPTEDTENTQNQEQDR